VGRPPVLPAVPATSATRPKARRFTRLDMNVPVTFFVGNLGPQPAPIVVSVADILAREVGRLHDLYHRASWKPRFGLAKR
jgi:hypothetical protein